jgi:hypothetical protein
MDPEISRRRFLALSGAAFVRTSSANDDELTPWWADCSTSPNYRPLARATAAEGFIVSVSDAGACSLSFIDDDFPVSAPIGLPPALARRELQVVGTARYEMSLIDASARPSLGVMFQEPADVVVYAADSSHGGVIIVALE